MDTEMLESAPSSRRPSALLASAVSRSTQNFELPVGHGLVAQRKYFLRMFEDRRSLISIEEKDIKETNCGKEDDEIQSKKEPGMDGLTILLSALYAKLLVVLGVAFPVTDIISKEVTTSFYQAFYLYLYFGSIIFLILIYVTLSKDKTERSMLKSVVEGVEGMDNIFRQKNGKKKSYGTFYLRLGAIAFGIGSMVYSGLEFLRYLEAKDYEKCNTNVLQALKPATRTILTLLQIQFIFLSSKNRKLNKIKILSRFGLMHLIATNLCEWLYVLVEETRHEIIHMAENNNDTVTLMHEKFCQEELVLGSLVANASPFLFPCTIEYSLICAVILFEMWKNNNNGESNDDKNENGLKNEQVVTHYVFRQLGVIGRNAPINSNNHFTVDCSGSHKGLFSGIMVIVLTIISLIMFFVLIRGPASSEDGKLKHRIMARFEVNAVELVLYIIGTVAVIVAMVHMRKLDHKRRRIEGKSYTGLGLDNTLLVVAQTGVFIHNIFSIIGHCFTMEETVPIGLLTEIFSFVQTSIQTIFVLDSWSRRCKTIEQCLKKPGKQYITFLIVTNVALWTINSFEKNRAEFRPNQLKFYGDWAWTVITHTSIPLAIFYRFHSTICLFEIWKSAYKLKLKN